jgi:hypothetical protein
MHGWAPDYFFHKGGRINFARFCPAVKFKNLQGICRGKEEKSVIINLAGGLYKIIILYPAMD